MQVNTFIIGDYAQYGSNSKRKITFAYRKQLSP